MAAGDGDRDPSTIRGSDFVVVANRLPVDMERLPDGTTRWKRSPGGLVTALEPMLRRQRGAWVGWPGVVDDGRATDRSSRTACSCYPVPLSAEEIAEYYEGFSNATLWPLYHDVIVKPKYHREWWNAYVEVNRRFAEATSEAAAQGATVWVQDYQLQLVPKMLRMLRPDLTIGFFLHIPFPPVELFMQMPWRTEIVEGLLGADLIGFHLPGGAQNFLYLARRLAGRQHLTRDRSACGPSSVWCRSGSAPCASAPSRSPSTRPSSTSKSRNRDIRRPRQARSAPNSATPARSCSASTASTTPRASTSGSTRFRELLDEGRVDPADTVMVQLATPSRERVESYVQMRGDIEQQVGRINGEYGEVGHPVVHYLHRPIPRDELIAFFVAADVMLVTPLRDGMNLVAKEYVACRSDLGGALVLSEFTGAAAELRQAYLCNPHDLDGVKDAIEAALNQTAEEGRRRMRATAPSGSGARRRPLGALVPRRAGRHQDRQQVRSAREARQSPIKPMTPKLSIWIAAGKVTLHRRAQRGRIPGCAVGMEAVLGGGRRHQGHGRPVDDEHLAADVVRGGRGKEPHQRHHVIGRQRIDLAFGQLRCVAEDVGRHRGARSRTDGVGPHPVAPERLCRRQSQRGDTGFGRTVVGLPGRPGQASFRRRVDDAPVHRPFGFLAWLRQYVAALRVSRKCPRKCTAMTASQSSSVMLNSMRSRVMPALLTTMLRPPSPSAHATSSSAVDRWLISPATAMPLAPAALISSSTSDSSSASVMSLTTTVAPDWASPMASARPEPAAAPVTTATRPERSVDRSLMCEVNL